MQKIYNGLVIAVLLFCFEKTFSQPILSFQQVITGLNTPVELVNAGDGSNRLFIIEQPGRIKVYDPANGGLQALPYLDISSLVKFEGEQGLLSAAFHPEYATNGYFFVYYNDLDGDLILARYHVSGNGNIADPASGVALLDIPKTTPGHNGGHLQFGQDGHLYFATGDGYEQGNDPDNNSQNGSVLLGKMVRINVDNFQTAPYYTVPSTNPFLSDPTVDNRIWALGLRNPFRWSFDRLTGDMWIGDVGQSHKEEINFRPVTSTGGENYGWRCYEGSIPNPNIPPCTPPNYIPPVFDYDNPTGSASSCVIGGYVYRGSEFPFLNGYYLAHDLYSGVIYLMKPDGSGGWSISQQQRLQYYFAVSYGEAEDGTLYVVSLAQNAVYKLEATSPTLPVVLTSFSGTRIRNSNELKWMTEPGEDLEKFRLEYSVDGRNFSEVAEVPSRGNSGATNSYSYSHLQQNGNSWLYRLAMIEKNGRIKYSTVIRINNAGTRTQVYPTLVRDGKINITSSDKIRSVRLFNELGILVFEKVYNTPSEQVSVLLPLLSKGLYFISIPGDPSYSGKIYVD